MSAIEALASKFDVVIGENTELSKNALTEKQALEMELATTRVLVSALKGQRDDLRADLAAAVAKVKGYEMAIDEVFKAYPVDIFPSPTHEEYQAMNKDNGRFVTRNSADVGRHIAKVIRERAEYFTNEITDDARLEGGDK